MQLLHTSALVVFWGCAALIVYAYIVYPVLLVTLGALRRAASRSAGTERRGPPQCVGPGRGS